MHESKYVQKTCNRIRAQYKSYNKLLGKAATNKQNKIFISAEFYKEKNYGDYFRINSTWNNHTQECYEYCGRGFQKSDFQKCLCSPLMKTKSYTDAAGISSFYVYNTLELYHENKYLFLILIITYMISAFFSLFFAIVGIVLNSLVLAALKNVIKDDVSCLNIMSLACSDLVKCILYLPVNHVRYSNR